MEFTHDEDIQKATQNAELGLGD